MNRKCILPRWALMPLAAVLIVNMAVYTLTGVLVSDETRHAIHMAVDDAIPFVPAFTVFYILAFIHWAASWLLIGRESRELCWRLAKADILAKLICLVCFLVYPTTFERPSMGVHDAFPWLLRVVWFFDKPVNCLPSIHALASWLALRASFMLAKPPKVWRVVSLILCAGCFASVVLIKQHYLIDVPAGILAAEIGLFLSKKMNHETFLWLRAG